MLYLPVVLVPFTNLPNQTVALSHSTLRVHPEKSSRISGLLSATVSPDEGDLGTQIIPASLRVGIVLHKTRDGYTARANTLLSFLDLNRQVSGWHVQSLGSLNNK